MVQGGILTLKSYSLRNSFQEAITAIDSDSSDRSGENKWKIFWKRFIILDAMKNICNSWEEVKVSTLVGVWKKLIPALTGGFEGLKTSVEEAPADVMEVARELELEVQPEA